MKSKNWSILLLFLITILGLYFVMVLIEGPEKHKDENSAGIDVALEGEFAGETSNTSVSMLDPTTVELLEPINDGRRLLQDVLPRARNGEPRAAFSVYRFSSKCSTFSELFGDDVAKWEKHLMDWYSQGDAVQYNEIRNTLDACTEFAASAELIELDPEVWLDAAARAGYQPALAERGILLVMDGDIGSGEELLIDALFSLEPEAALIAGPALTTAFASEDNSPDSSGVNELAWLVVACSLGLDCSEESSAKRAYCASGCTQSETAIDALANDRSLVGKDRQNAEALALEYLTFLTEGDRSRFGLLVPE